MRIEPFTCSLGRDFVLDFPGMELEAGSICAVIGSNGSGKSTFARVLSSVLAPDRGSCPLTPPVTVGYMPQKNYAFRMSTRRNILLGSGDTARAEELMCSLQLRHLARKRGDRLSGGETARMALARLMLRRFELVILDEPTAAMDMETTLIAEKRILRYREETGCAMILVTHSIPQARRLADRVCYFHNGKMVECGAAPEMLSAPKQPQTRQFLDFYG